MKKTITAIMVMALMLTGCANDDYNEETTVTTATSASETEAVVHEYNEVKVTKADELYDVYPVKFSYKNDNWWDVIDTNPIEEEPILLYNDLGMEMGTFKADYPQVTDERLDREVRKKINEEIKNYRDGLFERAQNDVNLLGKDRDGNMSDEAKMFYETARDSYTLTYRVDTVGKNFWAVYFLYSPYHAGAAPEFVYPVQMVFDLRTGERVDFEKIISDKEGFADAMERELRSIGILSVSSIDADDYKAAVVDGEGLPDWLNVDLGDGTEQVFMGDNLYQRTAVRDGCLGVYYTLYDFGFGSGDEESFFAGIPFSEAEKFLTDEGREIFASYSSAKTEPVNVIEYKGKRYFENMKILPDSADRDNPKDAEFIWYFKYLGEY
ncbi:MAG: hypothetical protein K2N71_02885 [Oscillospiraceae bacterium]|nr:hypothetical protein [Oscillospiraceae bacterium]